MRVLYSQDIDGASGDVSFVKIAGLSSETKPTANVSTGSEFFEVDTDKKYIFDETSSTWTELSSSSSSGWEDAVSAKADKTDTVLNTTLSLNRASGSTVGTGSVALGYDNEASGYYSMATGAYTKATGGMAFSGGVYTEANGERSHVLGFGTIANGDQSVVFGSYNIPDNYDNIPEWVDGTSYNIGDKVKVTGNPTHVYISNVNNNTTSPSERRTPWTKDDRMDHIEIVGNGTSDNNKSNARTLDWDGNEALAGDLTVNKGTANEISVSALKTAVNSKVSDVQVNGTSVVNNGVANVPVAGADVYGMVKVRAANGFYVGSQGHLTPYKALDEELKEGTNAYHAIVPNNQHTSTFYGLAKAAGDSTQSASNNTVGAYTESAKSAISEMLNGAVAVSGSTPAITANPGVRYICGECTTLTVVAPATGCIDIMFESGSTPTALTVTSAKSNTTIKWANGFDPTDLDTNTIYEVNILDGEFGVVASWT